MGARRFQLRESYLLWLRHVLEGESATRGLPRAFLTYDGLLRDWRSEMSKLADTLDLAWPRRGVAAEMEINRFLRQRHRHHAVDANAKEVMQRLPDWVRRIYAELDELKDEPDWGRAQKGLDTIRMEFDQGTGGLGSGHRRGRTRLRWGWGRVHHG